MTLDRPTMRELVREAYEGISPDIDPDTPEARRAYRRLVERVSSHLCCEDDDAEQALTRCGAW